MSITAAVTNPEQADSSRRAVVWLVLAVLSVAGCAGSRSATKPVTACRSVVDDRVLPRWARGGFSEASPRPPHVFSASGQMVAILFGYPLTSPPPRRHSNKILWVSQAATDLGSDLRISAQRINGTKLAGPAVARMVTGGPGPSTIDVPTPGCWRLTLRWSGRTDTVDLRYALRGDAAR